MGFAIKNSNPTLLITGDLSFFYDINGLWNQYIPPFVRIIIFNNGEGNIFKIIPGPGNANPNTLDEFIATKHHKNAEHLAKHFGFSYIKVEDEPTLDRVLDNFFKPDVQPKILEVNTYGKNSADVLKAYFNFIKEN
jgi:2-succinyl-5-enolpyruvyl-6-hydroxy-3-cyclohexene-1-carboxylate synthase